PSCKPPKQRHAAIAIERRSRPSHTSSPANSTSNYPLETAKSLSKPLNVKCLAALLKTSKNTNQKFGASVGSGSTSVEVDIQDLRDAISNGDIHPYFQSKICLATGAVIGAEVLARWLHPESGLVPPDQFITLAEQHGLIADLTWRLLRTALAETRRIREDSPDFRIAVNLSADLLYDLELPDRIATILSEYGLDADALALELTETTLLKPSSEALEVVGRLRLMGIKLSIDDFGTGQANLSTLSCYPFSELKIDQSFIKSALTNAKSRAIVVSCVELGRSLNMRIVAEGIENAGQLALVSQLGIDEAQGFWFSRPEPAKDFVF
ncbi:MAG: EAL domain-containing protein (putative c-di-GMP-specific phosphodiesterase class I), partial [Hyphomicrobiaceae bacterium]